MFPILRKPTRNPLLNIWLRRLGPLAARDIRASPGAAISMDPSVEGPKPSSCGAKLATRCTTHRGTDKSSRLFSGPWGCMRPEQRETNEGTNDPAGKVPVLPGRPKPSFCHGCGGARRPGSTSTPGRPKPSFYRNVGESGGKVAVAVGNRSRHVTNVLLGAGRPGNTSIPGPAEAVVPSRF